VQVMRTQRRDCRAFPAFTSGPSEFYARRVAPARPRPRAVVEEWPPASRPQNFVRVFPQIEAPRAVAPLFAPALPAPRAPRAPRDWTAEPAVIAVALTLAAPLGIPLLWASPRFTPQAKWAITGFFALLFVLATAAFAIAHAGVCG